MFEKNKNAKESRVISFSKQHVRHLAHVYVHGNYDGIRRVIRVSFLHRRHIFARRTVHYRGRGMVERGARLFLLSTARLEIPNLLAIVGTIGSFHFIPQLDSVEYCVTSIVSLRIDPTIPGSSRTKTAFVI